MKNKPVFISIIVIGLLISGFILFRNLNTTAKSDPINAQAETNTPQLSAPMSVAPVDKIEVVHFHGTNQCASCIKVGMFARVTIEGKFSEEVKSGKIVFKEINAEFPENQAIVTKYQARGSSLFVNAIRGDKDDITEDTTVWRLIDNEIQYITYFENKLKTLLGQ